MSLKPQSRYSGQTHDVSPGFAPYRERKYKPDLEQEPDTSTPRSPLISPEQDPPVSTYDEVMRELFKHQLPAFREQTAFRGGSNRKKQKRKIAAGSIGAALSDLFIVSAICCLFIILSSLIAHRSHYSFLNEIYFTRSPYPLAGVLFFFISSIYLFISRWFQGFTLGEWCFDLRLGSLEDFSRPNYPLKVLFRCTLMFLSGFVVFPLIFYLTEVDWVGRICRLELQSSHF